MYDNRNVNSLNFRVNPKRYSRSIAKAHQEEVCSASLKLQDNIVSKKAANGEVKVADRSYYGDQDCKDHKGHKVFMHTSN